MRSPARSPRDYLVARDLVRYVERNLAVPRSVALRTVAQRLALSERQLQRIVRAELETTFTQLVLRLRMERGIRLLQSGQSARSVASQVGYSHASGFAKAFRRYAGCSPSEFRRREKHREVDKVSCGLTGRDAQGRMN